MNLQVNLILDSERRSGSSVRMKFVFWLLLTFMPVALGLVIMLLAAGTYSIKQELFFDEEKLKQQATPYQNVLDMERQLKECQLLRSAMQGWGDSRCDWREVLKQIRAGIPNTLQLVQLVTTEQLGREGDAVSRIGGIYINGRVEGEFADKDVATLNKVFKIPPDMDKIFKQSNVTRFEADPQVTNRIALQFDIECVLNPRQILQVESVKPAGRRRR